VPPDLHAPPPAPPPPIPRRRPLLLSAALCVALAIATLAAYGGLHSNGFIMFDDDEYVTDNTHVLKGLTGESVAWAFTNGDTANWHPLTWLSHMLDVRLFGLNPGRHHLTSLLLHVLNVLLLFLFLLRLTGAPWRSAFVAALFALHPLHVESVAWIAERKDVLSTFFWLLTLIAWLAYVRSKKAFPYVSAMAFYALGLMAKPMLVTLPFTLLLLDFWPLQRLPLSRGGWSQALKGLLWEKAPLFAMSAASSVVTVIAQRSWGAVQTLDQLPLAWRVGNAMRAYAAYLGKAFWPSSLAVFYPHPRAGVWTSSGIIAVLVLAGVTFLVFRLARKAPYLLFGWLWYLGTLVPVIGLVQVGEQAMADRYTYIPLLGVFIAVTWGAAELAERRPLTRRAVAAAAVCLVGVVFVLTRIQTGYWRDTETLFGHALAVTSDNWLAHNAFGLAAYGRGNPREAIAHYMEALRINEGIPDVHNNLGLALSDVGQTDQAIEHYNAALDIVPDAPIPLDNLGVALLKLNRPAEAAERFERALKTRPDFPDARHGLGLALTRENRLSEALEQYEKALRLKPDSAEFLNDMGLALGGMNRLEEAIERLEQAVTIKPDFVDARINLGVALDHAGRTAEALEQFQRALKIKPGSAKALDNLGLALARMNRMPEALERFQQAVVADPESADAQCHLAIALTRAHRFEEARGHFEQALRVKPDFEPARAGLENVLNALHKGRTSNADH